LAIHADKNGKFDNDFLVKQNWGGGGKTEPIVCEKSQCLIKAREEAAVNLARLQSSNALYEHHSPHEWNTMEDQNGVSDYRTTRSLPSTYPKLPVPPAIPSKVSTWVRLT
jgi:hypothetical protein